MTTVKEDDAPCPDKERSENDYKEDSACLNVSSGGAFVEVAKDACTPKPALLKKVATSTNSKKTHNKNDYKEDSACLKLSSGGASVEVAKDACTPKPALPKKVASTNSKKTHNKKMATNTKTQLKSATVKSVAGTPHLVQENQAIKRQKLDEGKSRQVTFIFTV